MFIQIIKQQYHVSDADLAIILKCSERRIRNLASQKSEILVSDVIRICNHFHIQDDELDSLVQEGLSDNQIYRFKKAQKNKEPV